MRSAFAFLLLLGLWGCRSPINPYPDSPVRTRKESHAFLGHPDPAWFPGIKFDVHVPLTKNFYAFAGPFDGPKAFDLRVAPVRRWDLETSAEALRQMETLAADLPTKVIPKLIQQEKAPFWHVSESAPYRLEIRLLDLKLTSPMAEAAKSVFLNSIPGDQALLDLKFVDKATGRVLAAAHTFTVPDLDVERQIANCIQIFLDRTEAHIKRGAGLPVSSQGA